MLKRTIVSFATAAALSSTTFAAQLTQPGESGFYGGFGLGRSYSDVNAGAIAGSKDDKDSAWKAFGGYQFNRYLGVEAGYVDLGRASIIGPAGAAAFESEAWQASAVGSFPINQRFSVIGKLGVARTETDTVGNIGGAPVLASDRDTNPTYGLGLRYDFNRTFGVRGEWERFRTTSAGFGGKNDVDLFSVSGVVRFW